MGQATCYLRQLVVVLRDHLSARGIEAPERLGAGVVQRHLLGEANLEAKVARTVGTDLICFGERIARIVVEDHVRPMVGGVRLPVQNCAEQRRLAAARPDPADLAPTPDLLLFEPGLVNAGSERHHQEVPGAQVGGLVLAALQRLGDRGHGWIRREHAPVHEGAVVDPVRGKVGRRCGCGERGVDHRGIAFPRLGRPPALEEVRLAPLHVVGGEDHVAQCFPQPDIV